MDSQGLRANCPKSTLAFRWVIFISAVFCVLYYNIQHSKLELSPNGILTYKVVDAKAQLSENPRYANITHAPTGTELPSSTKSVTNVGNVPRTDYENHVDQDFGSKARKNTTDWGTVEEGVLYVYSAHLDTRTGRFLGKLFGALHRGHLKDFIKCQLWSKGKYVAEVVGDVYPRQSTYVVYPDVDIHCEFPGDAYTFLDDSEVTLTTPNTTDPRVKFTVEHVFGQLEYRRFTVCLWGPLYTDNSRWMVEWVETNILFGAQLFYIYVLQVTSNVEAVIKYYEKLGIIRVLPWHQPDLSLSRFEQHGNFQLAMIGDCHQRNLNQTEYLVGIDFDELIVPRGNFSNWDEMMKNSDCPPDSTFAMHHLLFESDNRTIMDRICSNSGICPHECRFGEAQESVHFLRTMCVTERKKMVLSYPTRSKYITSPTNRTRLAVHTPGDSGKHVLCKVNLSVGALHHYRNRGIAKVSIGEKMTYDNYMQGFWAKIAQRVNQVRNQLQMYL